MLVSRSQSNASCERRAGSLREASCGVKHQQREQWVWESKGRRHELITLAAVACDYAVGKADD